MILSDIRRYLQQRRQATLRDIARHFDSEPSAVQGMLEYWVRRGKVRCSLAISSCGSSCGSSCSRCDPTSIEIYQWMGDSAVTGRALEPPLQPPSCDQ